MEAIRRPSGEAATKEASLHDRVAAMTANTELPPLPVSEEAKSPPEEAKSVPEEAKSAPEEAKTAPVKTGPRPMHNLTPGERKEVSMQAELYSLFVTMERLEGAFVKGLLSNEDYMNRCNQMGTQFKTLKKAVESSGEAVEVWYVQNELDCPLAKERFLKGVTAIDEYGGSDTKGKAGLAQGVMEATENFITLTNSFELGYNSCEQLLPLLKDLQTSVAVLPQLQGVEKMTQWMVTLNNMRAREELSEDQFAQLKLDTEIAYSALRNYAKTSS